MKNLSIGDLDLHIERRKRGLVKTCRLYNEYYDYVTKPDEFIAEARKANLGCDLLTFLGEMRPEAPEYPYYHEFETIAILNITTYDHWWKNQISDKTRNMARKAVKKGIELRVEPFSDEFVRGIMGINNDCPMRQGRPFWHYNADFETTKRVNGTFADTSKFVGAYLGTEMVGYIKLVIGDRKASLMQILSKISQRDKAPTNALMAKAVEICAEMGIPRLHYALWSRRGLGDFKKNHGMEPLDVPRYFVPLNTKGKVILKLKMHRNFRDLLPGKWVDAYVDFRAKWYASKLKQTDQPAG